MIRFVRCTFDASASDIIAEQELYAVVSAHYKVKLRNAPPDRSGNITVEGRHVVITGFDGCYTFKETTPPSGRKGEHRCRREH